MMNRSRFVSAAVVATALVLTLSGCKDSAQGAGAGNKDANPGVPVSLPAIAAEAKGFAVGSPMSARTVYVFFDPQCPHCAALWQSAKPLKSQAKFVWIPVGLMNKTSVAQGAALLAASDPVATMDQHEASLLAKQGGITAMGELEPQRALVAKNTELFNRFGFASVPTIVGTHAQSGAVIKNEGALPTPALAAFLGLPVPAGN